MIKYNFKIILIVISLLPFLWQCRSQEVVKEAGTLMPFEHVSIDELRKMAESGNITKPQVNIRGIVIKKFICPPCPEGADCERCPEDHIVVSDGKSEVTIDCRPEGFTVNTEYCISLVHEKYPYEFPFSITGWEKNPGKNCRPDKYE